MGEEAINKRNWVIHEISIFCICFHVWCDCTLLTRCQLDWIRDSAVFPIHLPNFFFVTSSSEFYFFYAPIVHTGNTVYLYFIFNLCLATPAFFLSLSSFSFCTNRIRHLRLTIHDMELHSYFNKQFLFTLLVSHFFFIFFRVQKLKVHFTRVRFNECAREQTLIQMQLLNRGPKKRLPNHNEWRKENQSKISTGTVIRPANSCETPHCLCEQAMSVDKTWKNTYPFQTLFTYLFNLYLPVAFVHCVLFTIDGIIKAVINHK